MQAPALKKFCPSSMSGFTVIELLAALLLSAVLLAGVVASFSQLARMAKDQELRTAAQRQAQSVIDMMTPEVRMIGNGVPFHQANFLIAQAGLTDSSVTQPILVDGTTATQLKFRLNETGETYILTADFDPAAGNTIALTSTNKIFLGDHVYITNSTVGQDEGFWGVVANGDADAKTITFAEGTQYSPGAIFAKGSLLEVVPIVTYASHDNYGGITRDSGLGELVLVPNGQFSLEYLNSEGDQIALPLIASAADPFPASAIQNLRAIRLTVQVRSLGLLTTGLPYIATATQVIGVRNLNYKY